MNAEKTGTPNPTADHRQKTRIIHVIYVIAALDITWMFLQFSVTPVSTSVLSQRQNSHFRGGPEVSTSEASPNRKPSILLNKVKH